MDAFRDYNIAFQLLEVRKVVDQIHRKPAVHFLHAIRTVNKVDLGQSQEKGLRIRANEVDLLFALQSLDGEARESLVTSNLLRRRIMVCYYHMGTHLSTSIYDKARRLSRSLTADPARKVNRTDLLSRLVPLVHSQLANHHDHTFRFEGVPEYSESVDQISIYTYKTHFTYFADR